MVFRKFSLCVFSALIVFFLTSAYAAEKGAMKLGVMDIQKIITESQSGIAAKERIEAKQKELMAALEVQQREIEALKAEIEKKSTVWTQEKKDEKIVEFNKLRRDLKTKTDDARLEMKRLQEKEFQPILKMLEVVVQEFGAKNKFSFILDSRTSVLYFDSSYDVSNDLIEMINQKLK